MTLEILDSEGKLVRKFSSEDKPEQTQEELAKQLIPLYWIRPERILDANDGMHRWLWDLHYPAPVAMHHEYPISAVPHDTPRYPLGPRALPGTYTVRIGFSAAKPRDPDSHAPEMIARPLPSRIEFKRDLTVPLTVRMDPRVKASQDDLKAQFKMQMSLADMMTRSSQAIGQARSAHEQLEKLSASATGAAKEAIEALDKKIAASLDGPAPSKESSAPSAEVGLAHVSGDIAPLYAEVDRVDAAPTPAQNQALASIERDFSGAMKRWDALKSSDIPALNRQLKSASLPELSIESNMMPEEEAGSDEE